jgi:hypothetical protein
MQLLLWSSTAENSSTPQEASTWQRYQWLFFVGVRLTTVIDVITVPGGEVIGFVIAKRSLQWFGQSTG